MVVQTLPVDKLIPADYNPRKDLKQLIYITNGNQKALADWLK